MNKTLALELNNFLPIPTDLRSPADQNTPVAEIRVNLPDLFHQLYLDTYGNTPPARNPINHLYLPMLAAGRPLRFQPNGLGSHKEARIGESNKFGKAFCRWFLYSHCGINYFAHMDDVLENRFAHRLGPIQVTRSTEGDTPDYLCSRNARNLFDTGMTRFLRQRQRDRTWPG